MATPTVAMNFFIFNHPYLLFIFDTSTEAKFNKTYEALMNPEIREAARQHAIALQANANTLGAEIEATLAKNENTPSFAGRGANNAHLVVLVARFSRKETPDQTLFPEVLDDLI